MFFDQKFREIAQHVPGGGGGWESIAETSVNFSSSFGVFTCVDDDEILIAIGKKQNTKMSGVILMYSICGIK